MRDSCVRNAWGLRDLALCVHAPAQDSQQRGRPPSRPASLGQAHYRLDLREHGPGAELRGLGSTREAAWGGQRQAPVGLGGEQPPGTEEKPPGCRRKEGGKNPGTLTPPAPFKAQCRRPSREHAHSCAQGPTQGLQAESSSTSPKVATPSQGGNLGAASVTAASAALGPAGAPGRHTHSPHPHLPREEDPSPCRPTQPPPRPRKGLVVFPSEGSGWRQRAWKTKVGGLEAEARAGSGAPPPGPPWAAPPSPTALTLLWQSWAACSAGLHPVGDPWITTPPGSQQLSTLTLEQEGNMSQVQCPQCRTCQGQAEWPWPVSPLGASPSLSSHF